MQKKLEFPVLNIRNLLSRDIGSFDLLDSEEERDVVNNLPSSRDQLINSNLRLVGLIAKDFNGRFMDHFQDGTLGLIRAADHYNPSIARFSTYASKCISRSMISNRKKYFGFRSLNGVFEQERFTSTRERDPADIVEENELRGKLREYLRDTLDEMNPIYHDVISWYYGLFGEGPLEQKEIGKRLGFNPRSISVVHARALEKIKDKIESNPEFRSFIDEYFN